MTKYTKESPYIAHLKSRHLLNKEGSSKKTYHIELDIKGSGIKVSPGDSVALYPQNPRNHVQSVLKSLQATGKESVKEKKTDKAYPLEDFLYQKANLGKVTSLLLTLAAQDNDKLKELLLPENRAKRNEFLSEFEVWDFLNEYPFKLDIQEFCNSLLPQMPRFYSLASSQSSHPDELHLTVAELSYQSRGIERNGVASHFLCQIADIETPLPIYPQPTTNFLLPNDHSLPIIMIGPGTGVAPFRAFLQDRISNKASGKNWLFFGERSKSHDFYYEDFFTSLKEQNALELDTAFSRDQEEKIYVQHKLLSRAEEVFNWLEEGAYIYVCGDAKKMAKDVEMALLQIIREKGGHTEKEAFSYLKNLRKEKRYLRDVY